MFIQLNLTYIPSKDQCHDAANDLQEDKHNHDEDVLWKKKQNIRIINVGCLFKL